jgi:SpoIID/LytB domain protein
LGSGILAIVFNSIAYLFVNGAIMVQSKPSLFRSLCCFTSIGLTSSVLLGLGLPSRATAPLNPIIDVGIVQRFGENPERQLRLQATPGDQLTLKFQHQGKPVTQQLPAVALNIHPQPLPTPEVQERVVISVHRSFESAETSANQWRARGVVVEVAQPNRWQVWGSRQRYNTPALRQELLAKLKVQGLTTAYLDQLTRRQRPHVEWQVQGQRFRSDRLEISSTKGQMRVAQWQVPVPAAIRSLFPNPNPDPDGAPSPTPTPATKPLSLSDELFSGKMRLQPNTYGTFTLVNQVPVETYLRGVVPYEIGPQAPNPAVQAQAIIARTYALRNLRRFAIDNYQICADTQCQVYRGLEGSSARIDQAITATTGQVLTYNNELIDALYSSTTGGVTARFEDVWEGAPRPYLRAIIDAVPNQVWNLSQRSLADEQNFRQFISLNKGFNEQTWRHFRWRSFGSFAALNKDFRAFLKQKQSPLLATFQTIQSLRVLERAPSGRVQRLVVQTNVGEVILTKDEILRCFYAPNSLLFYLEAKQDPKTKAVTGYNFVGGGLGHAVGLSQTGSYRLADLGWTPAKILNFYYPGTRLEPLQSSIVFWHDANTQQAEAAQEAPQADAKPSQDDGGWFAWLAPLLRWLGWQKS